MKNKYLIGFFAFLMVSGMVAVIYYGVKPRPITKISLSVFANAEVVANALQMSISKEIGQAQFLVIGIDPSAPETPEIVQKIVIEIQSSPSKYDALVVDDSFPADLGLQCERFSIKKDPERFFAGIKTVMDKNLRLLVLVPPVEASAKLNGSLASTFQKQTGIFPMGIVFSNFPRKRDQENALIIPCNTGEEDTGGTADLGCLILQKSRSLYRKHYPKGTRVGLLDQVGGNEYLFMLTTEP